MTGISRWMITTILAAVALLGGQSPCLAAAKLYIPNYDSGSVSVIDTGTNSVTAAIGVGTLPMGVAVSHDGQRAYVAGNGSGSISVIDTLSDRVVTSFTVPGTVNGLALTPLGNRLYVTEKDGGIVRVIDTASGSIIAAVPGMSNPLALLAAADGTKVFASNQGNGAVTVISTADNSTHSISLGGTLGGMALTPDGTRLYVTKSSSNSVVVINTATNGVIWSIPVGNAPQHLAVSPDGGTLYVANTGTNTVSVINTATLTISDTIPVGSSPDGLTLTPSGDRLYVINSASGTMSVFDTSAKTEIATVGVGSRPRAYGSFIASASSRVYVASTGGNGIVAHDPADSGNPAVQQVLSGAATTLDGPAGVAVFGNEIIVSNGNQDSIVIFRKQDNGAITPIRTISGALTNLSGPEQVVVDGHEIFVASAAVGSHLAVFNLSDSGNTAPKRELTTIDQVATVAVYGDELYLGRTGSSGDPDTLYVFDRSATGAASPLRTLTGSSTGLATISGIAVYKNEIFVSNTTGNSITVYGRTDSGDTAPGRTISGGATLLNGPMGIIIIGDELFVANHGDNSILVFDRSGSGNVAPKRVIMGDRTGITAPRALAVESAWEPMIPTGPALYGSSFTYDEVHNKAIVYGGNDGGPGTASDVTWLWDGSAWSSKDTDNPPARFNAAMAYFGLVNKTLLFGGWEGTSTDIYRSDFWDFTGSSNSWIASGYSGAPPSARANAAVAYDSTRAEYLLFGGATPDLQNDTWTIDYSGGALLWVNRTTTGPTPRHFSRMAFDAARKVMVLFGGQSGFPGEFLQDTWEWNGSSWIRRAEYGPDPRAAQAMAYDPVRKRVVMYGGGGWGATEFQADTWEWTGSQWLRIDAGIPGEGDFGGMFYDKVQKRMILLQRDGSMWGSARMLDTRPPVVTSKVPAPSTVEVSRFATVSVSFNKEMDPATLNNINFSLYDGTTPTSGTVSYDAASRTATFSPSAILNSGTTYTATLSTEIRDASGTPLSSTVTFTFTTVTEVSGTITGTVNWVASKSPYVVSANLTVNAGATLNIEAGTVVKFKQNVFLAVNGTLNAQGTEGSPIYFTDYRDDSVGGDTNGSTEEPSAGWWRGIRIANGGSVSMNYCRIRYGLYSYLGSGVYYAPISKSGTGTVSLTNSVISDTSGISVWIKDSTVTATIADSIIRDSSSHAIYLENAGSGVTLSHNTISGISAGDGIRSNNSSPAITGNTVSGSAWYGLYVMGIALPSLVSGNTFSANTYGNVATEINSSGVVIADDNSFSGPIYVVAGGNITRNVSWVNNRVYYVVSGFTVNAGQTLTVPAGRVVKFAQNVYFNVSGTLDAQGTAESPIYFTDFRDDVGGDTNGTSEEPAAGWWRGIRSAGGGTVSLAHSVIRYGWQGSASGTHTAPLYASGTGALTVTDSVVSDTTGAGIWIENGTAAISISDSSIQNSSNIGILLNTAGNGVTLSRNTITNTAVGDGIYCDNSSPTISGNTITSSARYGLFVRGAALPLLVSGNTLSGNATGNVAAEADSSGVVIADDNSFAGPIHILSGSITRNTGWVNNRVYYVVGGFTVNAGQTLTVPAGRVVKFAQNVYCNVSGTLDAQGTAESPVYFTDFRDDVGGDSNGTSEKPAAGWWRGIRSAGGGTVSLAHSVIRYGWQGSASGTHTAPLYASGTGALTVTDSVVSDTTGHGIWIESSSATTSIINSTIRNSSAYGIYLYNAGTAISINGSVIADNGDGGIYINNSSSLIRENTIRNNTNNGIYLYGAGATPVITRNTIFGSTNGVRCAASANPLISGSSGNGNNIFGNSSYGVWNETTTLEVDASFNWWGSSTGPFHATKNAAGTGNAVSDYVYFGSFLASPDVPITYSAILPSEHYYGHVAVSTTTAGQVFTITNSGDQPMTFNSISLGGVNPGDFLITADTCSASSVPQGESCAVTVAFRPTAPGQRQAALEISSNDTVTPNTVAPLYGAGAAALPFRDDFTNAFSPYWAVLNQDADLYSLTTTAGSLAVSTTNTDFIGTESSVKNLFTVPIPTGINRLVVTAKILFPYRPSQNFQQGGIALLADKNGAPDLDSFIRASYLFDTGTRKFRVASEVNGATSTSQVDAVQIDTATPIYLRISKNGTSFRCEYSTDGNTYTLIQDVTGSWDIDHAGFFAVNGAGVTATSIPVEYDWFLVEGDPVADVTPASANYGAVQVGHSSPPQAFTVGNSGLGDLVVNGINPTGSDAAMFSVETGSCGTLPATIAPGDSCNFSVTFTPTSVGDHSAQVIVSTNDPATPDTSIGLTGGGTAFRNLTLAFSGTGTGSVVSNPPGIACNEGCSASFLQGTEITLTMIPNEYMVFNGWVGPCSGTGTCVMTLTGDTIVTAAIDRDTTHTCRIAGVDPVYYSLLQDAFNATGDGSIVEAWAIQFSTLPALYLPGTVTLRGGFNQDYSNNPEMTPLSGPLTIGSGALIIDRIVIQ